MREVSVRFMVVAIACGVILAEGPVLDAARESGGPGMAAAQAAGAVDHQAAAAMFTARLAEYETTRARLEEPMPAFDERREPWSLMLSRRYLASAIRAARPWARQGTVFSPLVAHSFRVLIEQHVPVEQRQQMAADAVDESYVTLTVQEPVPAWAMQPVPEALRQALPPLPNGIEYRVVAPSLILWDAHAEILIDVLPGAFLP